MRLSRIHRTLLVVAAASLGRASSAAAQTATASRALLAPDRAALAVAAPDSFSVVFTTSRGEVEVLVHREWAPLGADRLHYLATNGFFTGARFFRVRPPFVVQFGLSGNPAVDAAFEAVPLKDEPVRTPNFIGTLVFANAGPDTRASQMFFNLSDNLQLDARGFAPVGQIVRGLDVVMQLYSGYGEIAPSGAGPDQMMIMRDGNAYLRTNFPALDSIVVANVKR